MAAQERAIYKNEACRRNTRLSPGSAADHSGSRQRTRNHRSRSICRHPPASEESAPVEQSPVISSSLTFFISTSSQPYGLRASASRITALINHHDVVFLAMWLLGTMLLYVFGMKLSVELHDDGCLSQLLQAGGDSFECGCEGLGVPFHQHSPRLDHIPTGNGIWPHNHVHAHV